MELIEKLPINKGDFIFIQSDILGIVGRMREKGTPFKPEDLITSLQNMVGEEGLLLFPTYFWGFCSGKQFDYKRTRGETGALGNVALKMPGFLRTRHPIYSFAVWGKYAAELSEADYKEAFGTESTFAWMHKNGAKNLMIDVHMWDAATFTHYVEQQACAPYRYQKDFTAAYIDENDVSDIRTYSMYVRRLEWNVKMNQIPIENELIEKGIALRFDIERTSILLCDLSKAFDVIADDIKHNRARKICLYDGQDTAESGV